MPATTFAWRPGAMPGNWTRETGTLPIPHLLTTGFPVKMAVDHTILRKAMLNGLDAGNKSQNSPPVHPKKCPHIVSADDFLVWHCVLVRYALEWSPAPDGFEAPIE